MTDRKIFETFGRWLGFLGIGIYGNWLKDYAFDFVLYPFVIAKYGILWGAPVMTMMSFLVCYATILFYDKTKKDWLGIETLKAIKDFSPKSIPKNIMGGLLTKITNGFGEFTAWILKKSDLVVMTALSIQFDPFITVAYMRHGSHQYNGLSKRDWKIFLISLLIGNIYWTMAVFTGITILEALWRFTISLF